MRRRVTRRATSARAPGCARRRSCRRRPPLELGDGIHATIDEAVAAATRYLAAFGGQGLAGRKVIIDAVRRTMLDHAEQLARMAHQETRIGRVDDKVAKNRLVASKAPGPEDLEVQAVTGDAGMMVTEFAPFGIVAADHAGHEPDLHDDLHRRHRSASSPGNAVVFNAHPARGLLGGVVRLVDRAIVAAGGRRTSYRRGATRD